MTSPDVLPDAFADVSDAQIRAMAGSARVFDAGQAFFRENHLQSLGWDAAAGALVFHVADATGVYTAAVNAYTREPPVVLLSNSCTCPVRRNCKHVVCAVLAARHAARVQRLTPPLTPESMKPLWQRQLLPLLPAATTPPAPPRQPLSPLGLQFRVDGITRALDARSGTPSEVTLSVRPVMQTSGGQWKSDLSLTWHGAATYGRFAFDDDAQQWLDDLSGLCPEIARSYWAGEGRWQPLGSFAPAALWPALAQGQRLGVSYVGMSAGDEVTLAGGNATLSVNVARHPDGSLSLTRLLGFEGRDVRPTLIGAVGHGGLFAVEIFPSRRRITLAPTATRLTDDELTWLTIGGIDVPAGDVTTFMDGFYPKLRRKLAVTSLDGSAPLPEPSLAVLTGLVKPLSARCIEVSWGWRYGGTRLDFRSPSAVRDVEAEQSLVASVQQAVRGVPGFEGFTLAPRQVFDADSGLAARAFAQDVMPVLSRTDYVEMTVSGVLPDYADVEEPAQITVVTTDADSNDWFDLRVDVTAGDRSIPFHDLFVALAQGLGRLVLDDGSVVAIDTDQFARLKQLIDEARALSDHTGDQLQISRYQVGLWADLTEVADQVRQADAWRASVTDLISLVSSGEAVASVPLPGGLTAHLRPYQRRGYEWLTFLYEHRLGGILADDMGLGKTVQVLAMIAGVLERGREDGVAGVDSSRFSVHSSRFGAHSSRFDRDSSHSGRPEPATANCHPAQSAGSRSAAGPFLVVAPASVVGNWQAESRRFTPDLRVCALTQTITRSGMSVAQLAADFDVIVMSYAIFRLDFEALCVVDWAALIMDEAQFVKNAASRANETARQLPARVKLAVTGTPMENDVMELWALLSIVAPGFSRSARSFRETYGTPIAHAATARQRQRWLARNAPGQAQSPAERDAIAQGDARLAQLRRRLRPLLLRRTKEVVAPELPSRQEQILEVELSARHRAIYDTYLQRERQRVLGLLGDLNHNRMAILTSLTVLRRLALDASLIEPVRYATVSSAKLDVLMEQITEVVGSGHRALIFSQFTTFLAKAVQRLQHAGIDFAYLDGKTRARDKVIQRFREQDVPVFCLSLKAGGFGLTLTEADYVFLLDPWWNPATEQQAIDRTHRIGQTSNVMVARLVSRGTIEEKVMALQARKREVFKAVLSDDAGESSFASALTAEDIRSLLD